MTQDEIEEMQEETRLKALRQCIWDQWQDTGEFDRIHDVLVDTVFEEEDEGPTDEQVKALFMMLPAHIIGQGISWGFNDTEVGDGTYHFVQDNEDEVRAALGVSAED